MPNGQWKRVVGVVALLVGTLLAPSATAISTGVQFASGTASANEEALAVPFEMSGTFDVGGTSITYTVSFPGGSTAEASDFPTLSATVPITAGGTIFAPTYTFDVAITDDGLYETAETFQVDFTCTADCTQGAATSATGTILNDPAADPAPVLSMGAPVTGSRNEGVAYTFSVGLIGATEETATFMVNAAGFGANPASASDYSVTGGTGPFSIPAGSSSTTITVTPATDALDEFDEAARFSLASPFHATVGTPSQNTLTILDINAAPLLTVVPVTTVTPTEGNTGTVPVTLRATLSAVSGKPVDFTVGLTPGTATASDFNLPAGSYTIAAGSTFRPFFVNVVGDILTEDDETFTVSIAPVDDAATAGTPTSQQITILDNDVSEYDVADAAANEDAGSITFTVSRTGDTQDTVSVDYDVVAGTADGSDIVLDSGTLTYDPGELDQDIVVATVVDAIAELDETFTVEFSNPTGETALVVSSMEGTVVNDDNALVAIVANDADASEAGDQGQFTFTRTSSDCAGDLTVAFDAMDTPLADDADPAVDYAALGSFVVIPAGECSVTLDLVPLLDGRDDSDEVVTLGILDGGFPSYIADPLAPFATLTIADIDDPTIDVTTVDASASEENAATDAASITITRSNSDHDEDLTVDVMVTGTATSGTDYVPVVLSYLIRAGDDSITFNVTPIDDGVEELDETVTASLVPGAYVAGLSDEATVSITDTDVPLVALAALGDDVSLDEDLASDAVGGFTFVVDASTTTCELPITISWTATSNPSGAGLAESDGTQDGAHTFPATGDCSLLPAYRVDVSPVDDGVRTGDQFVDLQLDASAAYNGDPNTAQVRIVDDDLPLVTVSATSATEASAASVTFTFTRTNTLLTDPLVVTYAFDGTSQARATAGTTGNPQDFIPPVNPLTITIPAGQASASRSMTLLDDSLDEDDEAIRIRLIVPPATDPGAYEWDDALGEAVIGDNDQADLTLAVAALSDEGDTITWTLTRANSDGDAPLTIPISAARFSGTTLHGTDYTQTDASFVFAGLVATLDIAATTDNYDERDETIQLSIPSGGYNLVTGTASTLLADAATDLPAISVVAVPGADAILEGDSASPGLYQFAIDPASSDCMQPVTALFAIRPASTAAGTATGIVDPDDYDLDVLVAAFPGGPCNVFVEVQALADPSGIIYEGEETVVLQLLAGSSYDADPATATITILESDPAPTVTFEAEPSTGRFDEEAGTLLFTARLSHLSALEATLPLDLSVGGPGVATQNTDYIPSSTTLTIPRGQLEASMTFLGVHDDLRERDESLQVSLGAGATNVAGSDGPLALVVVDDDIPGFDIDVDGDLTVFETDTLGPDIRLAPFEVALNTPPVGEVTFVLELGAVDTLGEVLFTAPTDPRCTMALDARSITCVVEDAAAEDPIQFGVYGLDDDVVDGDKVGTIFFRVAASDDPEYVGIRAELPVTTIDDEIPGLFIAPATVTLTEAGAATTISVRLRDQPQGEVHVDIDAPLPLAASDALLDFDASNFATVQTFDLVAPDNAVVAGPLDAVATLTATALSDPGTYDGLAAVISATVLDDDAPEIVAGPLPDLVEGATGSFDLSLLRPSAGSVTLRITSLDARVTVLDETVTLTSWPDTQPVGIVAESNDILDGDRTAMLRVEVVDDLSHDGYDVADELDVALDILDGDVAGLLTTTDAVSVPEGGQATVGVRLAGMPSTLVVLAATSSNPAVLVTPAQLRFGADDWDDSAGDNQITVTSVGDTVDLADVAFDLVLSVVDADADDAYDGLGATVEGLVLDDDVAGFTLTPTGTTTVVTENTGTDQVLLALDACPSAELVFAVNAPGLATTPSPVSFGPTDCAPKALTLSAADDDIAEGATTTFIQVAVSTGATGAPEYRALTHVEEVAVTLLDDDLATLAASHTGAGTTLLENTSSPAAADSVEVRLSRAPTQDVLVNVTGSGFVADPPYVIFTPGDWSARAVELHALDDEADDGDTWTQAIFTVHPASDAAYRGLSQSLPVLIVDNDTIPLMLLSAPDTVLEGESFDLTLHLQAPATSLVTGTFLVAGTALRPDDFTVSPQLNFVLTPGQQDMTWTILARADYVNEGPETITVTLADVTGADASLAAPLAIQVEDDPVPAASVEIASPVQTESGGVFAVTVRLSRPAEEAMQATLAMSGAAQLAFDYRADTTVVQFAPGEQTKPVVLTVINDALDEDDEVAFVEVASVISVATGAAMPIAGGPAAATILDDDAVPTITLSVTPSEVEEGGVPAIIRFTLSAPSGRPITAAFVVGGSAIDGSDYTISSGSGLTIFPGQSSGVVAVTPLPDNLHESRESVVLQVGSVTNGEMAGSSSARVEIRNADLHLIVTEAEGGALLVTEAAGPRNTDILGVRLAGLPTGNVVLSVSSSDASELAVSPTTLTFTPLDWDVAKQVTLTGVDDDVDDGNRRPEVRLSVRVLESSPEAGAASPEAVKVTVVDDDLEVVEEDEDEVPESDFDITDILNATPTLTGATLAWEAQQGARGYQVWRADGATWDLVARRTSAGQLSLSAEPGDRFKLTYYDAVNATLGFARDGDQAADLAGWDDAQFVEVDALADPRDLGPDVSEQGKRGTSPLVWLLLGPLAAMAAVLALILLLRDRSLRRASDARAGAARPTPPAPSGPAAPAAPPAAASSRPRPRRRTGKDAGSPGEPSGKSAADVPSPLVQPPSRPPGKG